MKPDALDQNTGERPAMPPVRELNPACPEGLEVLVQGLIATDPDQRYQTAGELIRQIDGYRYGGEKREPPYIGRVFVALPFRSSFDEVFQTVSEASGQYRFEARRMDRLVMVDDIWGQIVQEIDASRVVVCDFSPDGDSAINPNVVTEAAHARAVGKPLIVISSGPVEKIPFDWRHFQELQYTDDPAGLEKLREDLVARIRFCEMRSSTG